MANTVNESSIKKLKLIFTVVDRPKAEFYLDVLSQFEVNFQMVVPGKGTANTELVDMLGLNPQKAVIFSVVREDMVDPVMKDITMALKKADAIHIWIADLIEGVFGRNRLCFL